MWKPSAPLLFAIAALMTASGLQSTLLAIRATDEGFGLAVVAAMIAAYFAGFVSGGVWVVRSLRRIGHIRAFAVFGSVASMTILVQGMVVHPGVWVTGRLATGVSISAMIVVVESWLNAAAPPAHRSRLMAVYTTTSIGGFGLGQLVLLGFDLETLAPFAVAAALTSLATLPVLSVPSTDPALPEIDPIHTPDAGRLAPVGVGTGITAGVTWGVIAGMGAVFAARHGLDADEASAFVGAAVLGGLVLQWPVGAVSDRVDRRSVVTAIGAVAVVVACAGVVLDDRLGFAALLLFGAALGALAMPLYPLSLSITLERAAPGHLLDTSATLVQLNGIGSMIGPLVAAAGLAVAGSRGFFLVLAVTFLANTLVAAGTRIADGARLPRRPFMPAPPRISGLTAAVASAWRRRPPSPPPW